ncbi:bifunctional non-homologous end joining protein LigD [Comamonas sp. BIGb0152]|uniref:DNA ligase D n=1 Tax=Comamonas sp. BIGb0152 TaxID=2940601 RepID=UPI0021675A0B|nr:DNA ligase D [Comamonas sp. BIGb0152]MCS4295990.1 bifunctional non-homologous end joining protein LigD [Comamonas sp. BIGb0152]
MPSSLSKYQSKRNFAATPEPAEGGESVAGQLQFVIQKHWASHLHYDLRLEMDGVMKSWAVPKGPSLDPQHKRMAVQVEDHPISYNCFEGQIPAGNYGAGKVIVWDKGTWLPLGNPQDAYAKGRLRFALQGHKLQGRWSLVRMQGKEGERQPPWLLIKDADDFARKAEDVDIVTARPDSVASEQRLAAASTRGAPVIQRAAAGTAQAGALPQSLALQLAVLHDAPPQNAEDWAWELKFDGYRMAARKQGGQVTLWTRNGKDWTAKMPALAAALQQLSLADAWLDGEVVALNAQGLPDFQRLQNAFEEGGSPALVYYLFDLPFANGQDLRLQPWQARRQRLQAALQASPGLGHNLRLSEAFMGDPVPLLASACALGMEGLVGKRKEAAYHAGRTADWIKLKCSQRQEFVIGGYTRPKGTRTGLGSLLLGLHDQSGKLVYAGNVGTGFSEASLRQLAARLQQIQTRACPFEDPERIAYQAHWVKPVLVAEVGFASWTAQGRLRHAVFQGLREDKPARQITREEAATMPAPKQAKPAKTVKPAMRGIAVSHGERILDASTGVTKLQLVRYYEQVAPLMMEHLQDRPTSLLRAPDGVAGQPFFQKHLQGRAMAGIVQLPQSLDPAHPPLLAIASAEGLAQAAQFNVLEFHTWNAKRDRILRPDRMSFDLDPGEDLPWSAVQEGAELLRVLLQEMGLAPFLKTSGGKGLHLVVPIQRRHGWETVKGFSKAIVQHLAATVPQRFVAKSGPQNRQGKIFVDYLRNGWGATTASAWSLRARPGMGVSVPIAWSELDQVSSGAHWGIQSIEARFGKGNAPWEGYAKAAVSITAAMKLLGYAGGEASSP